MTDKIIIDGIDVSECDHFREGYCHPGTGVCYKCDTNCQYAAFYLKEQLALKTQECEELKKANQHIDANRQCKGSKLKRIEDLISACEAGYTDEFIQKIYSIIQEPEPAIDDYSIIDRYRKALEEIEKELVKYQAFILGKPITQRENDCLYKILDIINKAKGEGNEHNG